MKREALIHTCKRWCNLLLIIVGVSSCSIDNNLFSPEPSSSYDLHSTIIDDSLREEVQFESGGHTLFGYLVRQPDSLSVEPHHTIIFHHGSESNIENTWWRVELLWRAGFSVFIYDYRGYGKSEGVMASEATLLEDAEAAFRTFLSQNTIDTTTIVHYGFSIGGVAAVYLATQHPSHAVITESLFSSGKAYVQTGTIPALPGTFLTNGTFDNVSRINAINTKLLMMHGEQDSYLPMIIHADALFNHAVNPKTLIRVKGAGHSNIPHVLGEQAYIDLITTFIRGS